jgi:hypothetical protein
MVGKAVLVRFAWFAFAVVFVVPWVLVILSPREPVIANATLGGSGVVIITVLGTRYGVRVAALVAAAWMILSAVAIA